MFWLQFRVKYDKETSKPITRTHMISRYTRSRVVGVIYTSDVKNVQVRNSAMFLFLDTKLNIL